MADRRSFYLPQLDGLRFLAYALVFISHYQWAPDIIAKLPLGMNLIRLHRHGGIGVDLFLVLSAYLITALLLIEQESTGKVSLKDFYMRRALRIWPLYYCALVLFYFIVPFLQGTFMDSAHQDALKDHGLAYLAFLGNFSVSGGVHPPLYTAHLWTVSLEEQFYLVWPLSFVVLSRSRRGTIGFLFASILLSIGARTIAVLWEIDGVWTSFFTRLDPFAMGALLALYRHRKVGHAKWSNLKFLLGGFLVCFALGAARLGHQTPAITWQYTMVAVGFTLVLDASVCLKNTGIMGRMLRSRLFVRLGKLSYGMYVYHMVVIALVSGLGAYMGLNIERPKGWFMIGTASFATTALAAHLSYEWLEKPFLRLKRRYTQVTSRPD